MCEGSDSSDDAVSVVFVTALTEFIEGNCNCLKEDYVLLRDMESQFDSVNLPGRLGMGIYNLHQSPSSMIHWEIKRASVQFGRNQQQQRVEKQRKQRVEQIEHDQKFSFDLFKTDVDDEWEYRCELVWCS